MSENTWLVNAWVVRIIRLAILAIGWSAMIINILLLSTDFVKFISYYTIQSNLIVLIWLTIAIIFQEMKPDNQLFSKIIRGAITLYVFVTFLVFVAFLETWDAEGIYAYTNFALHYFVPLTLLADWILTETYREYKWKYIILWLAYPLFYFIYTMIHGSIIHWYPYFFLDYDSLGLAGQTMWVFILIGIFVAFGALFVFLNKLLNRSVR